MVNMLRVNRELNIKGEVCPYTFVKTKLAIEDMEVGQILRVVIDHEPAATNIPRSVRSEGHEILKVDKINKSDWEIVIKKT